nr:FxsA family protein [Propionibacterium sp.]
MKTKSTWLLLGLLAFVIAEVTLLSAVGRAIGVLPLLLILVAEAAVGGVLLRLEGSKAWGSLRSAQQNPEKMGQALSDAALILVGALLLMLPGFLSDAVGILFLLPPTRGWARRGLTGVFKALTRRYRDQADLLAAQVDRSTVVPGDVIPPPRPDAPGRPDAPDRTIVRGEIED